MLVSVLVLVIVLGVIQVALVQHVRNTLVDCAAEGARFAAAADREGADGVARTKELISSAVDSRFAQDVTVQYIQQDGLDMVQITVRAPLPVVGFLGPQSGIEVQAHALLEQP